jgi:hypothetical protein
VWKNSANTFSIITACPICSKPAAKVGDRQCFVWSADQFSHSSVWSADHFGHSSVWKTSIQIWGVNDTEPCLVSCFAKCPFRAREGETLPRVLRRYQAFALPPGVRVQTCGSQWHPFRGGGVSEVTAGARPVTTSPSDTGVSSMGSDH